MPEMTLDEKRRLLEDEQNAGVELKSGVRPVMTRTQAMGAMAGKPELTDAEVLQANGAGGTRGAAPSSDNLWNFGTKATASDDADAAPQMGAEMQDRVSQMASQLLQRGQANSPEEARALAKRYLGVKN